MLAKVPAVLLVSATITGAQFARPVASGDGSTVYFATSLRQKNTTQPVHGKLFRFDNALHLQDARDEVPPAGFSPGVITPGRYGLSNAYDITGVTLSTDGKTVATSAGRYCLGDGVFCFKANDLAQTTITSGDRSETYSGDLRLSANGRWAFGATTIPVSNSQYRAYLVDVAAGDLKRIETPGRDDVKITASGRPVANDGTFVYSAYNGVVIGNGESFRRIPAVAGTPTDAVIDPLATFVVYAESLYVEDTLRTSLYTASVAGGDAKLLAEDASAPAISDDGSTVLYLAPFEGVPQVWLIRPDGSERRRITSDPAGITSATLSADARVLYALTRNARLVRIETDGRVTEVIPRTPWITPNQAGALDRYSPFGGGGFSADDNPQAAINGKAVRVAKVAPDIIDLLIPADTPRPTDRFTQSTLSLSPAPNSPFDGPSVPISLSDFLPSLLYNLPPYINRNLVAVHQDWSSLVTADNPARPGEVVHLYGVGFGPTTPAVPFGEPAPFVEPLARLNTSFLCFGDFHQPVRTPYQGLAPGLTGIYQLDLELPSSVDATRFFFECYRLPELVFSAFSGVLPVGK